ncbi:MAG: serine/threonine-protein kinase [Planctomycetota bacterium]
MSDSLVGTVVDDWKVTALLGEGAMGAVYEARRGPRRAAFKVAHPEKMSTDSLERFRREAQILMSLEDPYVVRCFAAGESADFVYLALEFMEGGTLADHIQARGPLNVGQAVGVTRRVLRGLAAVHAQGVVHRDIKPDNVLLDARGRPKLADFSMARHRDHRRITAVGTILGTADYMAPEQFSGEEVDQRADLYGVGALLFHLVSGRPPYQGRSSLAVLKQHQDAPLPDPGAEVPEARPLTRVVQALMAKSPDARPQDAAGALALLEGLPEEPLVGAQLTPLHGLDPLGDGAAGGARRPSRLLDLLAFAGLLAAGGLAGELAARRSGRDLLEDVPELAPLVGLRPQLDPWVWALTALSLLLLLDRVVAHRRGRGLLGGLVAGQREEPA